MYSIINVLKNIKTGHFRFSFVSVCIMNKYCKSHAASIECDGVPSCKVFTPLKKKNPIWSIPPYKRRHDKLKGISNRLEVIEPKYFVSLIR